MKLEKLLCLKYLGRMVRESSNKFKTMKLEVDGNDEDEDCDEEEEEASVIQLQQITQSVRGSSTIS